MENSLKDLNYKLNLKSETSEISIPCNFLQVKCITGIIDYIDGLDHHYTTAQLEHNDQIILTLDLTDQDNLARHP